MRSALVRHQAVRVCGRSWGRLLRYELSAWLGWIPGALGLVLRQALWPYVLGSCGKGVQFGSTVRLIHPHRIHLGDRVVIGDGCILDARTPESDRVITLGDDVMLSHGVMLSAKGGHIAVGAPARVVRMRGQTADTRGGGRRRCRLTPACAARLLRSDRAGASAVISQRTR